MRLQQLRAQHAATVAKMQQISTTIASEKRRMTDEERTQFDALDVEAEQIAADIAREEKLQAKLREFPAQPVATGDEAAAQASARQVGIIVGRDRSEDDPKKGFRDHREFLQAVMEAGRGRRMDTRLAGLRAAAGSDEQGEYSDPAGGFLVPSGVAPGILSVAPDSDPLAGLVRSVPMTAPTVSFNARVDKNHSTSVSGGLVVTRRPETVDGTSSRMLFEQVVLTANEEFGLAFASERILTDSPTSFVALLAAGFGDEYVAAAMRERISGTGVGERQGALNAGCKVSVAKKSGQVAATILKDNIDDMAARCWRYSGAVWLANHNTRPQLKSLVQVVGTGGNSVPYFTNDGGTERLDGRPIFFTEFAETLGTEGDLILIVPSEYLEGTYQSEQYAESIHVRFVSAERAFRFFRRNDGQWWWRSALTPRKGSTLSPVVTLATRS